MRLICRKWAVSAAVIALILCCAVAFAGGGTYKYEVTETSSVTSADTAFGGKHNNETYKDSVTMSVNSEVTGVFGGGYANGNTSPDVKVGINKDVNITLTQGASILNSSSRQCVVGGGYAYEGGTHEVLGNVNITMSGSNAAVREIVGGGYATNFGSGSTKVTSSDVKGAVKIDISAGKVYPSYGGGNAVGIYGGGYTSMNRSHTAVGSTEINISGGTFESQRMSEFQPEGKVAIFAGGYAYASCDSIVKGNTAITISGGTFKNVILYGGGNSLATSDSDAKVLGSSTLTIKGAAGMAAAQGIIGINGNGAAWKDGSLVKDSAAEVLGTKTLIFDGVGSGQISGDITDFDEVQLKDECSLTFTLPISSDVKKIVITGEYSKTAKKTVLALAAGSYTPSFDITGAKGIKNCEWDGMNLVVTGSGEESKENPAEPEKPIFEGDVEKVISKDVEAVAPAVSTDKTAVAAELKSTDITSSDLDSDASGRIVLKKSVVVTAGGSYSDAYMLPIFTAAKTTSADIVACSFAVKSSDLLAKTPQEVKLLKIKGKSSTVSFKYSDKAEDFLKDGYFTIQTSGDNKIADKAAAFTADVYKVTMFIKDNGDYDLDPTAGSILDPSAIVKASESGSGGSSGGCSAGFAAIALLAIVPVVVRRKK